MIGITIERNVTSNRMNVEPEDEGEYQGQPAVELVPEVDGRGCVSGDVDARPVDAAHRRRDDLVPDLVQGVCRNAASLPVPGVATSIFATVPSLL